MGISESKKLTGGSKRLIGAQFEKNQHRSMYKGWKGFSRTHFNQKWAQIVFKSKSSSSYFQILNCIEKESNSFTKSNFENQFKAHSRLIVFNYSLMDRIGAQMVTLDLKRIIWNSQEPIGSYYGSERFIGVPLVLTAVSRLTGPHILKYEEYFIFFLLDWHLIKNH